jgi:uncharacterized protein (DUF302 family)
MLFTLHQDLQKNTSQLRMAFLRSGLAIAMEWDVAADLRRQFGVELAACRVMAVYCPVMLLELQVVDPTAAATQPVRLALTERDGQTYMRLVFFSSNRRSGFPPQADSPRSVEERVVHVLRTIGARQVAQVTAA